MPLIFCQPYINAVFPLPINTFSTSYDGQSFQTVVPLTGSGNGGYYPFIVLETSTIPLVGSGNAGFYPFVYPQMITIAMTGSAA